MSSWHTQYRGQSCGRVLHFLYHYCGFDVAEMATVSWDEVHYHGRKIATYTWLNEVEDIPLFTFLPWEPGDDIDCGYSCKDRIDEECKHWTVSQEKNFRQAIMTQRAPVAKPCDECRALKLKISIIEDFKKERAG